MRCAAQHLHCVGIGLEPFVVKGQGWWPRTHRQGLQKLRQLVCESRLAGTDCEVQHLPREAAMLLRRNRAAHVRLRKDWGPNLNFKGQTLRIPICCPSPSGYCWAYKDGNLVAGRAWPSRRSRSPSLTNSAFNGTSGGKSEGPRLCSSFKLAPSSCKSCPVCGGLRSAAQEQ